MYCTLHMCSAQSGFRDLVYIYRRTIVSLSLACFYPWLIYSIQMSSVGEKGLVNSLTILFPSLTTVDTINNNKRDHDVNAKRSANLVQSSCTNSKAP